MKRIVLCALLTFLSIVKGNDHIATFEKEVTHLSQEWSKSLDLDNKDLVIITNIFSKFELFLSFMQNQILKELESRKLGLGNIDANSIQWEITQSAASSLLLEMVLESVKLSDKAQKSSEPLGESLNLSFNKLKELLPEPSLEEAKKVFLVLNKFIQTIQENIKEKINK